ncbi:MAG: GumC family protein [Polaribacter sp.]
MEDINKGNKLSADKVLNSNTFNIREEIEKYSIHWKWFLLGGILSISIAYLYLRYTTPIYSASTTILIKDNKKSGISAELEAFKDLGIIGGGSSNNPDNEIEILKSRKIVGSVVDTLDLTISYFSDGTIKKFEIYKGSPIVFQYLKKSIKKDTTLVFNLLNSEEFTLSDSNNENSKVYSFNTKTQSKIGSFIINKRFNVFPEKYSRIYIKFAASKVNIVDSYKSRIKITPTNKNSSVLKVSLNDPVIRKAEDFLNELIKQYNFDAVNDKNEVSKKTKQFIEDRLKTVGIELSSIQDNVKKYKTKFGVSGLVKEGELALEAVSKSKDKIIEAEIQLNITKWMQESLESSLDFNSILPSNMVVSDLSISKSIEEYNKLILLRNKTSRSAGAENPIILELESQISSLRKNLKLSLNNLKSSLELQLKRLNTDALRIESKVSSIPLIERGIIDIKRQQEIFSGLYSYLLKKKEETSISLAVTVPNAKIIDTAYGYNNPVSPKKSVVYLAALIIGILIPFLLVYIKNLLDTKIHSRKDIEDLTAIPFLGDIPHSETKEKIVIGSDTRSSTAEAFRLIRTNLDFILANTNTNTNSNTIFITSTTSGEGKSFISINLAAALSLSNKKVLLIGLDLRAPKVTEYLGISERKGVTNFITNKDISLDSVKFTIPEIQGLEIIASGVIPPNPAELLLTSRVNDLFDEVKKDYDYIIVDTAPVNLVTDTLLVAKYADMFLYVTRANYLDKRLLNVPQTLYLEKKLPNMSIVLNDTDLKRGYGYGMEDEKEPWYKKLF